MTVCLWGIEKIQGILSSIMIHYRLWNIIVYMCTCSRERTTPSMKKFIRIVEMIYQVCLLQNGVPGIFYSFKEIRNLVEYII